MIPKNPKPGLGAVAALVGRIRSRSKSVPLLALLLCLMAGLADAEPGGRRGSGGGSGEEMFGARLFREIGLTPDQERKMRDQKLEMDKQRIRLHSEKALLELDLRRVFEMYPVNAAEALKIGEKIGELEKKAVLLKVETWAKLMAGLTPEQHKKALDLRAEMEERRKAWKEEMRGERKRGKSRDGETGK